MAKLEEDFSCSGVCEGGEEKPGPLYVFSNVNDGTPKSSCKQAIRTHVIGNIDHFTHLLIAIAFISSLVQFVLVLILLFRCYKFCTRKRKRSKEKKRANKGMVVASQEVLDTDDEKVRGKHVIEKVELQDIKPVVDDIPEGEVKF